MNALAETLNERADTGDGKAIFSARVAENQRRVFRIAYSVLGNAADAEEVTQDAFLSAYQKAGLLRESEKFRAWINRIVFHLALNRRRGSKRQMVRDDAWHANSDSDASDGELAAENRIMLRKMREEIVKLPGRLQRVLLLSVVEEMEAADVGAALGIPAGTVRSRLHTARKLLLKAMR